MVRRHLLLLAVVLAAAIAALIHVGSSGGGFAPTAPDDADGNKPVGLPIPEETPAEENKPSLVRGLVLDADTRKPVAGADVRFLETVGPTGAVVTDDRGAWSQLLVITDLEDASVRISAPGYVPRNRSLSHFAQATLHVPTLVTHLRPVTCRVSGVVVDPAGQPVAGAMVFNSVSATTRVTNARGEFRAIPWGRGLTYLSVMAKGWPTWTEPFDPEVNPAQEAYVRIVLPPASAARGLVVDDLGRPVEGARVHDANDDWTREVVTDEKGRFTWPVTHFGCDWVYVEKPGYTHRHPEDYVLLHDRHEIRIVIERNVVLAGRVVVAEGGTLPLPLSVATGHDTASLGPEGTFRFSDHPPGEIALVAGRAAPFQSPRHFQQWMSFTGESQVFTVAPAERREDLQLEIGPLEVHRCRVLDAVSGRPVTGAVTDQGVTDARGEFAVTFPRGTRPARRMIRVTADGYLPYRGPCGPEIRLTPWREVEIRVLAPDGEPVAGLSLWPELLHMAAWEVAAVTDAEGRVRCRVAAPGPSDVRHEDLRFPRASYRIPAGVETTEWRLVGHPVAVTISVTDEAGRPLTDVRLDAGPRGTTNFGDGRIGLPDRDSGCRVVAHGRENRYLDPRKWKGRNAHAVSLRKAAPVLGRVVDSEGRPMPDVSVYARRGSRGRTNAEGRFRIGGIAAGEAVELQVWADGWPEQTAPAVAGGPEVEIRLPARGKIRVNIPPDRATGAADFIVFGGPVDDMDDWFEADSDDGRRFARHESGVLTLSVPAGIVNLWLRVPPGLPRHYLDLRVSPGGTIGLTYDFPEVRGLAGTVTDPAGQPLPEADVYLQPCNYCFATTDESGRFRFDPDEFDWDDPQVSVGPWSLVVDHADYAPLVVEDVDLTRDHDLSLRLRKGGRLTGRLVPPPRWVLIEVVGPLENHRFFSDPRPDGSFRAFGSLPAGPLRLRVTPPAGEPIERTVVIPDGGEVEVVIDLD